MIRQTTPPLTSAPPSIADDIEHLVARAERYGLDANRIARVRHHAALLRAPVSPAPVVGLPHGESVARQADPSTVAGAPSEEGLAAAFVQGIRWVTGDDAVGAECFQAAEKYAARQTRRADRSDPSEGMFRQVGLLVEFADGTYAFRKDGDPFPPDNQAYSFRPLFAREASGSPSTVSGSGATAVDALSFKATRALEDGFTALILTTRRDLEGGSLPRLNIFGTSEPLYLVSREELQRFAERVASRSPSVDAKPASTPPDAGEARALEPYNDKACANCDALLSRHAEYRWCPGQNGEFSDAGEARAGDDGLPIVGGEMMDRSIVDFDRACRVLLMEEQERVAPNTALIAVLCDAVRCSRELVRAMSFPPLRSSRSLPDPKAGDEETVKLLERYVEAEQLFVATTADCDGEVADHTAKLAVTAAENIARLRALIARLRLPSLPDPEGRAIARLDGRSPEWWMRLVDREAGHAVVAGAPDPEAGEVGDHPAQYAAALAQIPESLAYWIQVYVADQKAAIRATRRPDAGASNV